MRARVRTMRPIRQPTHRLRQIVEHSVPSRTTVAQRALLGCGIWLLEASARPAGAPAGRSARCGRYLRPPSSLAPPGLVEVWPVNLGPPALHRRERGGVQRGSEPVRVSRRLSQASTRAGTADLRRSNTAAPNGGQRFSCPEPLTAGRTSTVHVASPGSHQSSASAPRVKTSHRRRLASATFRRRGLCGSSRRSPRALRDAVRLPGGSPGHRRCDPWVGGYPGGGSGRGGLFWWSGVPGDVFSIELAVLQAVVQLADEFAAQSAQRRLVGVAGCTALAVVGQRAGRMQQGVERPPSAGVGHPLVAGPAQQHHSRLAGGAGDCGGSGEAAAAGSIGEAGRIIAELAEHPALVVQMPWRIPSQPRAIEILLQRWRLPQVVVPTAHHHAAGGPWTQTRNHRSRAADTIESSRERATDM